MSIKDETVLLLEYLRNGSKELRALVEASETLLRRTWDLLETTALEKSGETNSAAARYWRNVPGLLSARSDRGKSADG